MSLFSVLAQAIPAPLPSVSAQTATGAAALGLAWTTASTAIHLSFGQGLKKTPIQNHWLEWILPLIGVLGMVGLPVLIAYMRYTIDPLSLVALLGGHFAGSVAPKGIYEQSQSVNPATGTPGLIAQVPVLGAIAQAVLTPGTNDPHAAPPPPPHP